MRKWNLIILSIFAATMLISCGKQTQSQKADEQVQYEEKGIDLYGTYDENDLLITEIKEEDEGTSIQIPQIDGLKNEGVQKKINQDIHRRIKVACKEIENLEYATYVVSGNFANVFSIGVYIGGEGEDSHVQLRLNYNLVNGNRIQFEELFKEQTDVVGIVRNAFRQMLIQNTMNADYDENELYKMVKTFEESEEKKFGFSPSEIFIYHGNHSATIKMQDVSEEVTLYSRFETKESLYKRDDIGRKDIFTCVEIPENVFEKYEFGYLEDNFWRDFACLEEYIDEDDKDPQLDAYLDFKEDIYKEIEGQIEEYRQKAKENPDKMYICLVKPFINRQLKTEWVSGEWEESYTGVARVDKRIHIYEMSKETFDEVYKDILLEAYRYEYFALQGGIILNPTEGVTVDEIIEEAFYDYVTGEQVEYEQ